MVQFKNKMIMLHNKLLNKVSLIVVSLLTLSFFTSCEKMEDTYAMYEVETIYSPKVSDLTALVGYKTATLNWKNPNGNLAKKILVAYDSKEFQYDELIETVTLADLAIKGYEISVYTIDAYGNRSVPSKIYIFPSGE